VIWRADLIGMPANTGFFEIEEDAATSVLKTYKKSGHDGDIDLTCAGQPSKVSKTQ
jgi:hypothetical protein